MTNPKAFISYSWTSPQHAEWVISLASQLRENGIDVILDKWDLKEGHDAVAFMEKMVTDPEIKKVIVVLDKEYVEKADSRKGGVGTETQIISAEVYNKIDQNKFVAVITEKTADEKPYLPTYYKSRIYIDLSDFDSYASNFDQLLRWIFDKPLYVKPDLGQPPEFLKENTVTLGTQSRARRAIDLLRSGAQGAHPALDEYLSAFAEGMEKFRLQSGSNDDTIVVSIDSFLPYRNEYIEVLNVLARFWPFDGVPNLQRFLEIVARYVFRSQGPGSFHEWDLDNFKFIAHELFLYTIAVLIRGGRFSSVSELLAAGYYLGEVAEDRTEQIEDFRIFRQPVRSLDARNQRLKINRLSLHADLLEKRSHSAGLPFRLLMQADFVLYLRSAVDAAKSHIRMWWPVTLVFATFRFRGPFEIFARSQSASYFDKISPMLGVETDDELKELISKLSDAQGARLFIPSWQYDSIVPTELANVDKLATKQ